MDTAFSPVNLLHYFEKKKGVFTNKMEVRFEMFSEEYILVSSPVTLPNGYGL